LISEAVNKEGPVGAYIIKVGGFDDVKWEVRVGVCGKRNAASPKSVVVKSNGRALEAWLLALENRFSKPINQNGARR
jgi:hypothetical protein